MAQRVINQVTNYTMFVDNYKYVALFSMKNRLATALNTSTQQQLLHCVLVIRKRNPHFVNEIGTFDLYCCIFLTFAFANK